MASGRIAALMARISALKDYLDEPARQKAELAETERALAAEITAEKQERASKSALVESGRRFVDQNARGLVATIEESARVYRAATTELEALDLLVREINEIARELELPKIPSPRADLVGKKDLIVLFHDTKHETDVRKRVKELRQAAAA